MTPPARNGLGPASWRMLRAAGIGSLAELKAFGSVAAYAAVARAGGRPSLNLLWALEGAITDRPWQEVARQDRLVLLTALEAQSGAAAGEDPA